MVTSVEKYSWVKLAEEFQKIVRLHNDGFREELAGLIQDMEPFIKDDQKVHLENALEDFMSTVDNIAEEIDEEMDALEERRLARACGFVVRLSNGT